jgi:TupA-like ATPgrasp
MATQRTDEGELAGPGAESACGSSQSRRLAALARRRHNREWLSRRAKVALRSWTPDLIYIARKCLIDFRVGHGGYPNLLRPRSFSEKIQYRKLFDRRPILVQFADKLHVRDYVRDKVGAEILSDLYHVTGDARDIPLDKLPRSFVVKPTHGCGWIEFVRDKNALDPDQLGQTCEGWLDQNFFYVAGEWVYKNIEPFILFEELLDDGSGQIPFDYKFFVFDGRVEFLTVEIDRFGDHRRNVYDPQWNKLQFGFQRPNSDREVPRPAMLPQMLRYAEALCVGFDFLRVDLYCLKDRIVFGEITTTPGSGLEPFWPGGTDCWIGDLWKMDFKGAGIANWWGDASRKCF